MKQKLKKRIGYGLILVFIFTGCSPSSNQWTRYPIEDGSGSTHWGLSIEEDLDGNLWVATGSSDRIPIFDRSTETWSYKQLPNTFTGGFNQTLARGREGDMWIGTGEGLIRYQFQQDTWLVYTEENGLGDVDIRTIFQDSHGTLWVGTAATGLYRSTDNGLTWQAVSVDPQNELKIVFQVYEDNHNSIWVSAGAGIYTNEGDSEEWIPFTHPNQPQLLDRRVEVIYEDSRGLLWFGTTVGLAQYDPAQDQWQTFTTENVLSDDFIHAIAEDKTGDLWFGTSDGVTRFSPANGDWKTFNDKDGFTDAQVIDILSDRDGNLWFVTFGDGVYKFDLD